MRPIRHARGTFALVTVVIIVIAIAACGDTTSPTGIPQTQPPARSTTAPDPSPAADAAVFGAWRRAPVKPTGDFAAAVEAACRGQGAVATRPLAVLDARGEGLAILVFADGASAAVCRTMVDQGGAVVAVAREIAGASGVKAPVTGALGIHDLEVVQDGASARSILVGQVGGGVHTVAANFDADAAWFTASMANGWYAIWWPGTGRPLGVASSDIRSVVIDSYAP